MIIREVGQTIIWLYKWRMFVKMEICRLGWVEKVCRDKQQGLFRSRDKCSPVFGT